MQRKITTDPRLAAMACIFLTWHARSIIYGPMNLMPYSHITISMTVFLIIRLITSCYSDLTINGPCTTLCAVACISKWYSGVWFAPEAHLWSEHCTNCLLTFYMAPHSFARLPELRFVVSGCIVQLNLRTAVLSCAAES